MSYVPVGTKPIREWPLVRPRLNRCFECRHLLWPWQAVLLVWDPESSTRVHHDCYHRGVEGLWRGDGTSRMDRGDKWWHELQCEHGEMATSR